MFYVLCCFIVNIFMLCKALCFICSCCESAIIIKDVFYAFYVGYVFENVGYILTEQLLPVGKVK